MGCPRKREDEDHLPDEVEPDRLVREAAAHPPISTLLTSLGIGLEHFLEVIVMFMSHYCTVYVHCSASCNHLILITNAGVESKYSTKNQNKSPLN